MSVDIDFDNRLEWHPPQQLRCKKDARESVARLHRFSDNIINAINADGRSTVATEF
jgi:hypothetical protein